MTTYTYTRTSPNANIAPKNDQPTMLQNAQSISDLINEDHIGFNIPNGGFHKVIRQMASGTSSQSQNLSRSGVGAIYANTPTAVSNVNQFLSGLYTPDTSGGTAATQLFSVSGSNVISQLTGFSLGDNEDGWQWIGGVLLQWGRAGTGTVTSGSFSGGNAAGTVTFQNRVTGAIPFPNTCFVVITVPQYAGTVPSGSGTVSVNRTSLSKTQFQYRFNSDSIQYTGFYWFAVGN
jgi:hypothetical protein